MILSAAEKKNQAIRKRRKIAIIAIALLVAIMAVSLIFVLDYVRTSTFVDRVDGTTYYIRYRDKAYGLYDTDKKTLLPKETQYGCYVTHSGTLVEVDAATGEVVRVIYVDTSHLVGAEQMTAYESIMMFRHVEAKDIRSVVVVNDNGHHSYEFARFNKETLKRDDNSEFVIMGSALNKFDEELFSSLRTTAGYSITAGKVEDPIKDEQGRFSEYGLVPERRVDDDGNEYDYVPTYYILTEKSGTRHKVIIGDRLVTGTGYYAQYVKIDGSQEIPFDAVYILGTHIADSLLLPIKDYVVPELTYPMTANTSAEVELFKIHRQKGDSQEYEELVSFSYVDMSERENTSMHYVPYRFDAGPSPASSLKGYVPSAENISRCINALYEPSFVGIHTFELTPEALVETGLHKAVLNEDLSQKLDSEGNPVYELDADYMVTFYYSPSDDQGNRLPPVQNVIMISGPNENGNYYAMTEIRMRNDRGEYEFAYNLNMIVEIEGVSLHFLTWDSYDWISDTYIQMNIALCGSIKIETKNYSASFTLSNPFDISQGLSSDLLSITGSDSLGHSTKTFAEKRIVDQYGATWIITTYGIKIYNTLGEELKYTSVHFENNCLGEQAQVDKQGVICNNGDKVYIYADYIETHKANGTVEKEIRYQTALFRDLYKTFTNSSIMGSYPLADFSEEERNALLSDENCIMTLTFISSDGEEFVYRFYHRTSRKAFMTLNGNGEFYVTPSRLDKFVSDCQRFFNLEPIDETSKA